MNVLFVSECSGNALTETRHILDQFAERRGERSWQTAITDLGLQTVRRLLRKTARRNTAVACLWIRGKDHTELVWVVGNARRFNAQGGTPTNSTQRDILRRHDENDWRRGEVIRLLASLAALWHDFGKANQTFQAKLQGKGPKADAFRHEWVSVRIFEAFVGPGQTDDRDWLGRLANPPPRPGRDWLERLSQDGISVGSQTPLSKLPPLAKAVGWLILSHHRLPVCPDHQTVDESVLGNIGSWLTKDWCGASASPDRAALKKNWSLPPAQLPSASPRWRERAKLIAQAALQNPNLLEHRWLDDPQVIHLARLALILADHYYSNQPGNPRLGNPGFPAYANTQHGQLNQRLDEHLIGVQLNAARIARALPYLDRRLSRIARHKGFSKRESNPAYQWQNRAHDLACALRDPAARQGFFGVNMASTGCGKTLANGRICYGLAPPERGARFTIALGLRTLTLQTGEVYRERLHLGPEDLAVLVGGGAIRQLHEHQQSQKALEAAGRESAAGLMEEQNHVSYEGSLEDGPLRWLAGSPRVQQLLDAPVLICTIDHLMPATESTRGGHQMAPMLRLLDSDLVLDEPDDFDVADLWALSRLVHWAGMLGSRVLLSSATLPPALIRGLFQAYLAGRRVYQQNRGEPNQILNVCCAWFDEFHVEQARCQTDAHFQEAHGRFVDQRLKKLAETPLRRRAEIKATAIQSGPSRESLCGDLARLLRDQIGELHDRHAIRDPHTGKRVSIGLIRIAHIDPLFLVAQALARMGAPDQRRLHLCVYHSQHPLLIRSRIEEQLDSLLKRHTGQASDPDPIFSHLAIRAGLDQHPEPDQTWVVIATAVAEVGRDHDYDWAIVEPSSMRSIIQLAGRVRRHRAAPYDIPNICLLDTNLAHLEAPAGPAFCKPGFESREFPLNQHSLFELLTPEQVARIDSSARIRAREPLQPRQNLADLEHEHLAAILLGAAPGEPRRLEPAHLWWTTQAALTGELQRKHPFRADPDGRQRYALLPNEDGEIQFWRMEPDAPPTLVDNLLDRVEPDQGLRVTFWGAPNFTVALEQLADQMGMELRDCARRFGVIDLPARGCEQGWRYGEQLGFNRKK